jgi:hypothetical protein
VREDECSRQKGLGACKGMPIGLMAFLPYFDGTWQSYLVVNSGPSRKDRGLEFKRFCLNRLRVVVKLEFTYVVRRGL